MLVVRGDGRYVRWLAIPRWLAKTGIVLGTLTAIANAGVLLDYGNLYRRHASLVVTHDRLARDAKELPPIRRRLTEVRDEMTKWEALHLDVWKPLGGQQRAAAVGIGGPSRALPIGAKSLDEIDMLLAYVREETRRLRTLAQITREAGGVLAALPSRLPLRSTINSSFGPRLSPWTGQPEFHAGVDLAAAQGTPITATQAGLVRFAGTGEGYGNTILLDHGAGVESRYGHLQKISVTRGQRVERGQLIGLSGNTGRSTAAHLHYEVLVDGRPVDPRRLARRE